MSALYNLSIEQFNALEMHSFLNLLNVISLQLEILREIFSQNDLTKPILEQTRELTLLIKKRPHREYLPDHIQKLKDSVWELINQLEKDGTLNPDLQSELEEAKEIFKDVFKVLDLRISELNDFVKSPSSWHLFTKSQFEQDFAQFFHAVEKNSRGKYRIVQNIAEQEPTDYLINFNVDSQLKNQQLAMPILFKDVIRDLIANARKYTPPGGSISVAILQNNDSLKLEISDTGIGIPNNEVDHVFEYGYRGTNVKDRQTMGGGFGLTKALYTVVQLNGDMWLESEVDKGTKITIKIPVPPQVLKTA